MDSQNGDLLIEITDKQSFWMTMTNFLMSLGAWSLNDIFTLKIKQNDMIVQMIIPAAHFFLFGAFTVAHS